MVYDILYDIFTDSARFKCSPGPVQMQPLAGSNATRFESNARPARPLHLSVCPGIEIGLQWFITPYQGSRRVHLLPPPSSSTSSPRSFCLGACLSGFGARSYHSTSLHLMYQEHPASSTFFKTLTISSACASARPSARVLAAPPMYETTTIRQAR